MNGLKLSKKRWAISLARRAETPSWEQTLLAGERALTSRMWSWLVQTASSFIHALPMPYPSPALQWTMKERGQGRRDTSLSVLPPRSDSRGRLSRQRNQ